MIPDEIEKVIAYWKKAGEENSTYQALLYLQARVQLLESELIFERRKLVDKIIDEIISNPLLVDDEDQPGER